MSSSTITVQPRAATVVSRLSDYVELTKPRIAVMVLVTVAVAGFVASWGQPNLIILAHALWGTLLVASSASALNQWIEQDRDVLMARTANRPLPAGRLSNGKVLSFAVVTFVLGMAHLVVVVNPLTAVWAGATWVVYVWIYTPLKLRTPWNTAIGAISGALPMLIGWSAAGGSLDLTIDPRSAALFLLLFLWQFPHFMAIAWIYREQYGRAGLKMMTVVDGTGRRAGVQAVLAAVALLPVSIVPAIMAPPGSAALYASFALLLGLGQLGCAARFFYRRDLAAARQLLRASLVYLPALMISLLVMPWV